MNDQAAFYKATANCVEKITEICKLTNIEDMTAYGAVMRFRQHVEKILNNNEWCFDDFLNDANILLEVAFEQGYKNDDRVFLAEIAIDTLEAEILYALL